MNPIDATLLGVRRSRQSICARCDNSDTAWRRHSHDPVETMSSPLIRVAACPLCDDVECPTTAPFTPFNVATALCATVHTSRARSAFVSFADALVYIPPEAIAFIFWNGTLKRPGIGDMISKYGTHETRDLLHLVCQYYRRHGFH